MGSSYSGPLISVSVVIPTYNRRDYVLDAVRSVLAQTCPPEEVIVVDDGSTDGTAEALRARYPDVRCLRQGNSGKSAARNTGVRAARGAWVAFLDSDDLWDPRRLELLQGFLASARRDVGLVFANYDDQIDGVREEGVRLEDKQLFTVFRRSGLRLADVLPESGSFSLGAGSVAFRQGAAQFHLLLGNFVPMCSAACPRSVFDEVGYFEERLSFCEDWELWLRIARRHPVAYLDAPVAVYRHHREQAIQTTPRLETKALIVDVLESNVDLLETMPAGLRARARRRLAQAYTSRAAAYLRAGRTAEAAADCRRGLAFDPRSANAYLLLALAVLPGRVIAGTVAGLRRVKASARRAPRVRPS